MQVITKLFSTLAGQQLLTIELIGPRHTRCSLVDPFFSGVWEWDPPEMREWELLDQIPYKLGVQAQERGEIFTFTFGGESLIAATMESLAKLLSQFSQIGICQRIPAYSFIPLHFK